MVFTVPVSLFDHFAAVLTRVGVGVELDFALIGGSSNWRAWGLWVWHR